MASGRAVATPTWRADVKVDSARVGPYLGTYRPEAGALPYGDGAVTLRWRGRELVLEIGGRPVDVPIPQGDDRYLLRNLWSELKLVPGGAGHEPGVTIRPLWFTTDARPLKRVP
jgi:hypothetical protein